MAFKFVVAVFGVVALVNQASAACHLLPPPCSLPAYGSYPSFPGFPAAPALPSITSFPCPPPAPPKVNQKPDVNIPLPLPASIPLGNFCTCQKYAIKPALLPCAPAPAPYVPAPAPVPWAPLPAPVPCAAAPSPLSPALLQTLLSGLSLPAPAPPCGCH